MALFAVVCGSQKWNAASEIQLKLGKHITMPNLAVLNTLVPLQWEQPIVTFNADELQSVDIKDLYAEKYYLKLTKEIQIESVPHKTLYKKMNLNEHWLKGLSFFFSKKLSSVRNTRNSMDENLNRMESTDTEYLLFCYKR